MHSNSFFQPQSPNPNAPHPFWNRVRQWIRQEIIDDDPCDQEKTYALRLYERFRALERSMQAKRSSDL